MKVMKVAMDVMKVVMKDDLMTCRRFQNFYNSVLKVEQALPSSFHSHPAVLQAFDLSWPYGKSVYTRRYDDIGDPA